MAKGEVQQNEEQASQMESLEEAAGASGDLQARLASLEESLLRAKADYSNLHRRMSLERADAVKFGTSDLMKSLVGVLDDFERAIRAAETAKDTASLVAGIRMVHDNFRKALTDHGLEPIESLHQPFDPTLHEAIMQQPSDVHPPGTVTEEVAPGYRLHGRLIRPAKVVVSKPADGD